MAGQADSDHVVGSKEMLRKVVSRVPCVYPRVLTAPVSQRSAWLSSVPPPSLHLFQWLQMEFHRPIVYSSGTEISLNQTKNNTLQVGQEL